MTDNGLVMDESWRDKIKQLIRSLENPDKAEGGLIGIKETLVISEDGDDVYTMHLVTVCPIPVADSEEDLLENADDDELLDNAFTALLAAGEDDPEHCLRNLGLWVGE